MKKTLLLLSVVLSSLLAKGQQIPAYTAEQIMQSASSPDTIYIINFWATWCVPCVQELPEFNDLHARFNGKPVNILLVSLDFKDDYPYKLASFVSRKRLTPDIAWLAETDPNRFIPKIEESWEGSIPATLIIQPGKYRKFIEGQITEGQVTKLIGILQSNR